jgi:SAM-dependent methyltransferase
MISAELLAIVRCPECRGPLRGPASALTCTGCGCEYRSPGGDYLDLRPRATFAEQTKYLDEALHADARHETVSPPLLQAGVRNAMLRRFLAIDRSDRVVDLGCGSGRALVWNRDCGARMTGIDISPFFAAEARERADLLLGDLRRLPFADRTFTKAYSLDVLEHLSPAALADVLAEAARVLEPGGRLFVYTHVRRNAWIAGGLRLINRLARALERAGLIDLAQERLRKSDHLNPLADIPELERVVHAAGFRIARIRYYTPLVGGFIENILMRLAERALARRAARTMDRVTAPAGDAQAVRAARLGAKRRIAARGPTYAALVALTWVMKIDIVLFGRVRSGPFFALLERDRASPARRATA